MPSAEALERIAQTVRRSDQHDGQARANRRDGTLDDNTRGVIATEGIYCYHAPYTDTGVFSLYSGTDAADADELMRVVVGEMAAAANDLNEAEVARAKAQMKAGLLMALESCNARAQQLASQMLAYGRPMPLNEIITKVDAVTVESARAAGRGLIGRGRPAIAALGPGKGLDGAASIFDGLKTRAA